MTADVSELTDPDGDIVSHSYQWEVSSDGVNWSKIAGATNKDFNIGSTQSYVGKYLRVEVTTTDSLGGSTKLTSLATKQVQNLEDETTGSVKIIGGDNPSEAPAEAGDVSTLSVDVSGLSDQDDDKISYSYQWQVSTDGLGGWADIPGQTGSSFNIGSVQTFVDKYLRVKVTTTDKYGGTTVIESDSTAKVQNVEDEATGTVSFLTSTVGKGVNQQTILTANLSITDADGLVPSKYSYQWYEELPKGGFVPIAGAVS